MALKRGTPAWFKHEKLHLVEGLKAFDSFETATHSFAKLVALGANGDEVLRESLHTAGVIHYGRPFSANRVGDVKYSFPKTIIKSQPGYEEDVHQHLVDLRNKLVAHSDRDFADGNLFKRRWMFTVESETFEALAGAAILAKTINTLQDMVLAEKFLTHVKAAAEATDASLRKRLEEFTKVGQEFYDELKIGCPDALQAPILMARVELSPTDPKVTVPRNVLNPHAVLKQPPLTIGKDGYTYRSVGLEVDVSSTVTWQDPNGVEHSVTRQPNKPDPSG
jgi:hypothetical protein